MHVHVAVCVATAKGRTNLELREQFILADGVSQSMTPFKSKAASATAAASPGSSFTRAGGATGPITKVGPHIAWLLPFRDQLTKLDGSRWVPILLGCSLLGVDELTKPDGSDHVYFLSSVCLRVSKRSARLAGQTLKRDLKCFCLRSFAQSSRGKIFCFVLL